MTEQQRKIILITGYSGAGMSSVLKKLEDIGMEVFDNFPLSLVGPLLSDSPEDSRDIAIGIDTRTRGFSEKAIFDAVEKLNAKLVFITCDHAVLQRRFTETRRRHPLAKNTSVRAGIDQEHEMLKNIQHRANLLIDTTDLSIHDLRHILDGHFREQEGGGITITLMSFGFKNGLPREADIVMDVRFLKNPHWKPKLKPKTGKDKEVGDYIEQDPAYAEFIEKLKDLIMLVLPRYAKEGKNYLTIAIGCTGGKHRSVYTVEQLTSWMKHQEITTHTEHRDLKE